MTVGVAAVAEGGRAIVMMADKQLTDMETGVKSENEEFKGFILDNGWAVMYAGDPTFAELVVSDANGLLTKKDKSGNTMGMPVDAPDVMAWVARAFANVYDVLIDFGLFKPEILDMERYRKREYDEASIRSIEAKVEDYQQDETADLLVCGFDSHWEAKIVAVGMGRGVLGSRFATIGTGGPLAEAQLVAQRTRSTDHLCRVVYEVFVAKKRAEANVYVGERTDGLVIFNKDRIGTVSLSDDTQDLLKAAMEFQAQTPFRSHGIRDREKRLTRPRRPDWEDTIHKDKFGPVFKQIKVLDEQYRKGIWP